MMARLLSLGAWMAGTALAQTAGPALPAPPRGSPAEQAIAIAAPGVAGGSACPRGANGEIVVCGGGRSPYRLPLPEERVPRRHAGEPPPARIGNSPVGHSGMAGVTVDLLALGRKAAGRGGGGAVVIPSDRPLPAR